MYAIASLLDPNGEQVIRNLSRQFELRCGISAGPIKLLPHFTWVSAASYQLETVERILADLASRTALLRVRSAGLGIFTGKSPVVYVPLIKDQPLLEFHQLVWEQLQPYAEGPNTYYNPDRWIPHITLALHDVQSDRLGCAVADVMIQPIEFEIIIDQFAILYQADGNSGIKARFEFAKRNP